MASEAGALPSGDPARETDSQGIVAARSQEQLEHSQTVIRETTKWLVAAAGAVGAVLVAGLQLSSLPNGLLGGSVALVGFLLAILGVAWIILTAAGVLSVGYTTLGQLVDLREFDVPRQKRNREWDRKILSARENLASYRASSSPMRRWLLVPVTRFKLLILRRLRGLTERFAKSEGVKIRAMLDYLNRDAILFSNGLAGTIYDVYDQLRACDDAVLRLRTDADSSLIVRDASNSGEGSATASRQLPHSTQDAEWMLIRLESAGARLIAFANQKVIEAKFDALKKAVRFGGLGIVLGIAIFVASPRWATPVALTVDKPTDVTVFLYEPSLLGPRCEATELVGTAVGGTWSRPVVAIRPSGNCRGDQLQLESGQGYVVPKSAAVPTPTPAP